MSKFWQLHIKCPEECNVLGGIGAIIVFVAALLMSTHDGTIVGYRFWLIICAAISIYVVFKMPETSERINRNQKIAAIVGIIVVSYFIFNQIDEPDNSFLGKFSIFQVIISNIEFVPILIDVEEIPISLSLAQALINIMRTVTIKILVMGKIIDL